MADECRYYYYESGYCCALKREKEGSSSIDSDTVHRYCWGYHYEDCPRYKSYHSSSSSCFLTSACVEAMGLPDDCHELTVLRNFRDGYLRSLPTGQEEIAEYYAIAPSIVAAIQQRENALSVFDGIYEQLVLPCVRYIEAGENEQAHALYRNAVKELQKQF